MTRAVITPRAVEAHLQRIRTDLARTTDYLGWCLREWNAFPSVDNFEAVRDAELDVCALALRLRLAREEGMK